MEQENYTNEELYQYLVKILDNLGKDRKITEKKRVIPRKITIEQKKIFRFLKYKKSFKIFRKDKQGIISFYKFLNNIIIYDKGF